MELINNNNEVVSIDRSLIKKDSNPNNKWNCAHEYFDDLLKQNLEYGFVEPNISSTIYKENKAQSIKKSSSDGYLDNWPKPEEKPEKFIWHLQDNYSQLKKAYNKVLEKTKVPTIKIAVIDTGYQKGHPALPKHLTKGISFIKGEEEQPAIDKKSGGDFEQNGHGTAIMCILAGNKVKKEISDGTFEGIFGCIPFAEIVPIRICETVGLLWTDAFVKAVDYAITQNCEIISMSMAGAPTKAWARVVNKAYENGIILVSAAGNSWTTGSYKLLPKRLLYPARWERVIAVTGVASDNLPYVFDVRSQLKSEGGEFMQGNYGPSKAMETAIAAYTPNISWATLNENGKYFRLDGGGTSSATPQIAAAAALWICYYKKEIEDILSKNPNEKWKKVELVRRALFGSADKKYPDHKKYFGQGILKAADALSETPNAQNLIKSEEATVSFYGISDLLGILLRVKNEEKNQIDIKLEMFELEIVQEIYNNPKLHKFLDYNETERWTEVDKSFLKNLLLESNEISDALRLYLNEK